MKQDQMYLYLSCWDAHVGGPGLGLYLFEAHHSLPYPMPVIKHIRQEDGTFERTYTYPESCVQAYALDKDGTISEMVGCIDLGSTTRWAESNPYSAVWSPLTDLIAVADKGSGYLYLYTFDYKEEKLQLLNRILTDVPGAHPRYVVFHPTKPRMYVNHEASLDGKCNVSAFHYNDKGETEKISMVNALTQDPKLDPDTRLEQQGFAIDPGAE